MNTEKTAAGICLYVRPSRQKSSAEPEAGHVYHDLQAAFDDVQNGRITALTGDVHGGPVPVHIFLDEGIYSGQFYFDGCPCEGRRVPVALYLHGAGQERTVITGGRFAREPYPAQGGLRGTFRTYTLFVSGPFAELSDLTVENTAGNDPPAGVGVRAGQAVALYDDAEYTHCRNVALLGHQDTLFIAPLPLKERIPGGFAGPRDGMRRVPSVHLYEQCVIGGTTDFIFGSGAAFFDRCTIQARAQDGCEGYYVAAPSADVPAALTPQGVPQAVSECGFVFYRCTVDGDAAQVYLARPWRPYARCACIACRFGKAVAAEHWSDWNGEGAVLTSVFTEYHNQPAASSGCGYGRELTDGEANALLALWEPYRACTSVQC